MPSDIYKALMDQTKSIAEKNAEVFKSEGAKSKKWTPAQVDTCTPEHLPGQVSRHLHTCTPEHLPTQVHTCTPAQVHTYTPEQVDTCTPAQVEPLNSNLKPKDLKLNQYKILHEIYFKRPFKVKGPERIGKNANIPYGTVRNILKSLVKKGYISKPFSINDGVNKGTTCQVNESKCVPIFGATKIINSEHLDNRTPEHLDNRTPEHLDNRTPEHLDNSYKKERKMFLNNLSFYLKNSDFWKQQGLSFQKCQSWIDELSFCDPDMLTQQLQYAEFMDKVKTADNPISYVYKTLQNGGFTRPPGFEFPEEKAERLQKEDLEVRQAALASLEKLREQEKELADKEAFYAFLADKKSVTDAINDIENQYVTPKFKASLKVYHDTGKIDSRLEKRLEQYFLAD